MSYGKGFVANVRKGEVRYNCNGLQATKTFEKWQAMLQKGVSKVKQIVRGILSICPLYDCLDLKSFSGPDFKRNLSKVSIICGIAADIPWNYIPKSACYKNIARFYIVTLIYHIINKPHSSPPLVS
jgi:hypothetical protein